MNDIEQVREGLRITASDSREDAEREKARQEAISSVTGKPYQPTGDRNAAAYGSIQFGPDGSVVSRTGGGLDTTAAEEAVLKAKSVAQAELDKMEAERVRLVQQREAITGYDSEGQPKYVLSENARERLRKQIAGQEASIQGQARLNERRFRREANAKLDKLQAFRDQATKA